MTELFFAQIRTHAMEVEENSKVFQEWQKLMRGLRWVHVHCYVLASSGEMSDFQAIVEFFEEKNLNDSTQEDGMSFHSAKDYATYLSMQTNIT